MSDELFNSDIYIGTDWKQLHTAKRRSKKAVKRLLNSKTFDAAVRQIEKGYFRETRNLTQEDLEGKMNGRNIILPEEFQGIKPLYAPHQFPGSICYKLGIEEAVGEGWFSILHQDTPHKGTFLRGYTQLIIIPETTTMSVNPCGSGGVRTLSIPARDYITTKFSNGWVYTGDKV